MFMDTAHQPKRARMDNNLDDSLPECVDYSDYDNDAEDNEVTEDQLAERLDLEN